jgi:preprotein translocase subunit SecE
VATFEIYKRNQGKYTRTITFVAVMAIGLIGAYVLSQKLYWVNAYLRFGIPTLIILALGVLMAWILNRPRTADFLIATEGEMKKVSWSSRKEIIGSTKVVIVTTIIIALSLFGVDIAFVLLFRWLGVMGG